MYLEQEMFQMAVDESIASMKPRNMCKVQTIDEAVNAVCVPIEGDPVSMEVRRSNLLKDALKESRKAKFKPTSPLMVTFVGEGAIDHGGPRREFFRLLTAEAQRAFFTGCPDYKFFDSNVSAIQANDLYSLGVFTAMSITQGGNGFPFLAECVYKYFCSESTGISVPTDKVPDQTLRFALQKLTRAENDDELKMVFGVDEVSALLMETGYRKPLIHLTVSDKPGLRAALLDYHCVLKVKAAMDQYAEGLQQLKVLDLMRKYPLLTNPFFISDGEKITSNKLKSLVHVQFSEEGSNVRKMEEQAWINFLDFLDECEEGNTDCGVNDVLVFFSGSDHVPPLGFSSNPKVSFLYSGTSKFCTSSTCDIQLRVPTCHGEDYQAFRDAMIMSIKDNDGFGGV